MISYQTIEQLLRIAREEFDTRGMIRSETAARLEALGYNVGKLENAWSNT